MSHIKNMQNFDKVIAVCTGLGGNYNPGKQNLSMEFLTAMSSKAHAVLEATQTAKTNSWLATNHREMAFEDLSKLAARIVSELKSSGVLDQTVNDARYIQRKLTGFRASRDPIAIGQTGSETGAAQPTARKGMAKGMDFTTQAYNFREMLKMLQTEPLYQPVAEELKLPALETKLATLMAENAEVLRTTVALKKARTERDEMLYLQRGSVFDVFHAAKQWLKATYGTTSKEFKDLTGVVYYKPAMM